MRTDRLSNDEVCRKFFVRPGTAEFQTARTLSDDPAPDRITCTIPSLTCPHCAGDFVATPAKDETRLSCKACRRTIHVERLSRRRVSLSTRKSF
jgi:transposase-like protein